MIHDPLCPCQGQPDPNDHWHDHGGDCGGCECDGIAKGRKAERDGIDAVRLRTAFNEQGYRDGQRDMLAKCIAAVEAFDDFNEYPLILAALQALEVKP